MNRLSIPLRAHDTTNRCMTDHNHDSLSQAPRGIGSGPRRSKHQLPGRRGE